MKENDIRPQKLFERYLELSIKDARSMLKNSEKFVDVPCPGCGSTDRKPVYSKHGFNLNYCAVCNSLYCSPRPCPKQLDSFYKNSESANFWANVFFPAVVQSRRQNLFRPKAKAIYDMFWKDNFQPEVICDVGAGYGLLLEELSLHWKSAQLRAIEPNEEFVKICRQKGFKTLAKTVESASEWSKGVNLVLCLEVIEHVYDTAIFVNSLFDLIKPGGYCLVTGLCSEGFDIQILKEKSNSVFPPHHINFLSVKGAEILFNKAGFKDIKITTPGQLDVDIVRNKIEQDKNLKIPNWVHTVLERGDSACLDFQSFLVKHNLSSHMWIVARKP
ncbi:MAG: class I SAM-dependent methyltransferase [Candidatus Omnitrophica bacterium]|nr:class I SAM-dependent methyltransferase [Candidatus Omnitrophota bacterium]MDD5430365.1 class I SAM-dependent methyltransferase [Candidatus Omnitrophota bacterium]